MATPTTCVFDLVPPRRPGIDDVGGGAKVDNGTISDLRGMPCSADDNQHQNLLVRLCGIIPACRLSVHVVAGAPGITKCQALTLAVVASTFTTVDNGVGDTSITWAANTFPAAVNDPQAFITGATPGEISCEAITNGVRVRTLTNAGVAVDLNFNVEIFG